MSVIFGRLLTSISLIAFSIYIWIESGEFPANGDQLPRFCAIIAVLILSIMLIKDLLNTLRIIDLNYIQVPMVN